jgi:hypothetical protein
MYITLKAVDAEHTRYNRPGRDHAGWKTVFIWLWSNAFYCPQAKEVVRLLQETQLSMVKSIL